MLQAVEAKSMPVGLMERLSPGTGGIVLAALITSMSDFLNLGKNLTGEQIAQTAELILTDTEAKNLKPEDYKVIFDNARKGLYGKTYDRLDGQVIFEWIRAYMGERMALCEQISIREHNVAKKETNLVSPAMVEYYKEILENVKKATSPEAEKPAREKPPRQKSEREKLIQMLFAEFDERFKKEGKNQEGVARFLKVDGKMLDQVEYVEYKLAQMAKNQD